MELLEPKETWVWQEVTVYQEKMENLVPSAQLDKKERLGSEVSWDQRAYQAHKESLGQEGPQENKELWASRGSRVSLESRERQVYLVN